MSDDTKNISDEQIEVYKEAFTMYDKNHDGKISLTEFADVISNLGLNPTKDQLQRLMEEIDTDGSETVEFNEFVIWMSIKMSPETKSDLENKVDLENTFRIFDEDGDRFITAKELKNVMNKLGQTLSDDEVNLMIQEADTDGDKRVNFKEFVQLMKKIDL